MSDFLDQMGEDMIAEAAADPVVEQSVQEPEALPAEPEAAPVQSAPEPERPEPGHVPIQALLDEREKRKSERQQREALERQLRDLQTQQQTNNHAPDLYDDPEGYAHHMQQQLAETEWKLRRDMSANFAKTAHGQEKLEAAIHWAGQKGDPYLQQRFVAAQDPYGLLVEEYNRDQLLTQIGNRSLDDFVRQRAAELAGGSAQQPGAPAPNPQQAASPPTRSLARAQGTAGAGHIPQDSPWEGLTFALDKR